jgi:hypothetical protein
MEHVAQLVEELRNASEAECGKNRSPKPPPAE